MPPDERQYAYAVSTGSKRPAVQGAWNEFGRAIVIVAGYSVQLWLARVSERPSANQSCGATLGSATNISARNSQQVGARGHSDTDVRCGTSWECAKDSGL